MANYKTLIYKNSGETIIKIVPEETKTRRVQLIFRPKLYDKVKRLADKNDMSVNEFICQTLEMCCFGGDIT